MVDQSGVVYIPWYVCVLNIFVQILKVRLLYGEVEEVFTINYFIIMYGGCLVVGCWWIAWIQQARHNRSAAFKLYMFSSFVSVLFTFVSLVWNLKLYENNLSLHKIEWDDIFYRYTFWFQQYLRFHRRQYIDEQYQVLKLIRIHAYQSTLNMEAVEKFQKAK